MSAFGFEGRKVLLTIGLLSPNKGIETVIEALPAIVARHPDVLYVVLGASHPHLVAQDGERYREWLEARSEEHTSELQSLMRISYAVFCLKTKKPNNQ